ncbi:MAG: peptidase M48, partial [Xenophilus sp.]
AGNGPAAAALLDPGARPRDRAELMLAAQAGVAARRVEALAAPLRDWVALHPRDAGAWHALSAVYEAQGETLRAIRADAEARVAMLDYVAARDRLRAAQDGVRQAGPGVKVDHYEASIIDARARAVEPLAKEQLADQDKPAR